MLTLNELLCGLKSAIPYPEIPDIPVSGLCLDSRLIEPGDIFCATLGAQWDGRVFIPEAIARGAAAVLFDPQGMALPKTPYAVPCLAIPQLIQHLPHLAKQVYPLSTLRLIGVTGTNGKTSVTHLLAQALTALKTPCGVLGTVGNGIWPNLQASALTTADLFSVHRALSNFEAAQSPYCALEVSSHALVQKRLGQLPFEIGVFTNLTQDHLDFHLTMTAYAAAKAIFFREHVQRVAILNADDPYVNTMAQQCPTTVKRLYYGQTPEAEVHLNSVSTQVDGTFLSVNTPWGKVSASVPLLGLFNVENLLAVISVLGYLGYSANAIAKACTQCQGIRGRMEIVHRNPLVVIDYAHTPDALEKTLSALRTHAPAKIIVMFGCGGDRDRNKRPKMAAIAERLADHTLITEDNMRFENPEQIYQDILSGFSDPKSVTLERDRRVAIMKALQNATPQDVVLLAGKGHECYINTRGEKRPFDERQIVKDFYA